MQDKPIMFGDLVIIEVIKVSVDSSILQHENNLTTKDKEEKS